MPPTPTSNADQAFLKTFAQTRAFLLGRPVRPAIAPDGREVLFLRSEARSSRHDLFSLDVLSGHERCVCTAASLTGTDGEHLSEQESARRERQRITDTGLTSFEISSSGESILIPLSGAVYLLNRHSGQARALLPAGHPPVMDARFTPEGCGIAFVSQNDLWLLELPQNSSDPVRSPRALTTGGTPERFFGLPEFVAQEEMSRFEGYWFSPNGERALVAVVDERAVEEFFIADPLRPARPPHTLRYPRPGKANADVGLQLVSRDPVEPPLTILWDRTAFPYLARVLWQSPACPPALWVQSRDQKRAVLLSVNLTNGATTPLFEERDEAWINLDAQLPQFLPDGSGLLHVSEASGTRALELRSVTGQALGTLVPGDAGFLQLVFLDMAQGRALVLLGGALTSRLAWVSLSPSVTFSPGWLRSDPAGDPGDRTAVVCGGPSLSPLIVESRVSAGTWPTVRVLDEEGLLRCELTAVAEPPPPVQLQLTVVGDLGFNAAIIRPHSFDAAKSYPVIIHVYGGPHALMVKSDQRHYVFDQWLANHGAIVVAIDNRGTPRRGRSWERAISGRFGDVPLQDQVDALQALGLQVPQMDLSRVGVYGWSFGGFMAALAALRRPDVFKVAVAGAPVVDWADYDTHYTERYLGLPDAASESYRSGNLLSYAARLSVPLLLIHGTADDNVYFFHSLKLTDALLKQGQTFDFLPLSGITHQIGDPLVRERLWGRVAAYLFEHL